MYMYSPIITAPIQDLYKRNVSDHARYSRGCFTPIQDNDISNRFISLAHVKWIGLCVCLLLKTPAISVWMEHFIMH